MKCFAAESLTLYSESPALIIIQQNAPFTKFLAKHLILTPTDTQ